MNAPTLDTVTSRPSLPPSTGRKPKLTVIVFVTIALLIIGTGIVLFLNRDRFLPDEHYITAIKLLKAKDYEGATSQFRLAIEDRPDDSRAKAMLAYAVVRTKLDATGDSEKPDQLRTEALNTFLSYYAQIAFEGKADQITDTSARKWEKDRIDDAEHSLRDQFKGNNIPFTDWVEFKTGVIGAAKEIYALPVDPDDPLDNLAKDVSAALLARDADQDASAYLVKRCATDPDLCRLTLVAGDGITKALAASTQEKGSFLAKDGQNALCYLQLKPAILDFVNVHPGLRPMHRDDLAADQRAIYDKHLDITQQYYYTSTGAVAYLPFGSETNQLLLSNTLQGRADVDPLAIHIDVTSFDKDKFLACIGGFDGKSQKYVSRLLYWDGKQWQRPAATAKNSSQPSTEIATTLPGAGIVDVNEDPKAANPQVALATYECRDVPRTRTETRYRAVTTYSQQWQFNPKATYNTFTHQWQGQYMWMSVPNTTQQPYQAEVAYTERVTGLHWTIYKLDAPNNHLWFIKDQWTEGNPPFDGQDPGDAD